MDREGISLWPLTRYSAFIEPDINPLNAELNPICHLLALLGAHHILHVSRIRVNVLYSKVHACGQNCVMLTHDYAVSTESSVN